MSADATDRGYVICTYGRSGSNYLCQLLESTDVLGRPADYFNGDGFRRRGYADYPLDPEAQLRKVFELGRTPNGVYGLKMFCGRFDRISHLNWISRLPNPYFVHLEREDILGQAISDVRANQTGQYRSTATATSKARYDRVAIRHALVGIVRQRARWSLFFARNGIEPLRLVYETIALQPQHAVNAVAQLIGNVGSPAIDIGRIALRIQRNAHSQEWRERFLAEERDPTWLDGLQPPRLAALRSRLARMMRRMQGQ